MANVTETTDAPATTATSYVIGVGQTAQGTINVNGDQDFWRVDLVAGRTYTFAMTGTGTNNVRDTLLSLRSADGITVLATNDNGLTGNNSVITFTASTTGSFYLVASATTATEGGRQYGLSVTEGTRASFDIDMGAGVMDADVAWNTTPGTSVTVTYAFRLTDSGDEPGFAQLTAAQMSAVQSILATFSEVSGINFTQVNPGGYSDNATILFSNYNNPNDGAGAYAYYPGSTASTSRSGDVYLNTSSISTTSLPVGSFSYFAIMHELGHALGLSHPGLYNAAPGVSITYSANAQFTQDTQMYSVMSYFDEANTGASNYSSYADTLMLNDILALQNIYGANMTTRSGNTVYGYNSNAGSIYDFSANAVPAFSIWDGGGIDTIDLSLATTAQSINLNGGTFSSVKTGTYNMSIAKGAIIENVIGGIGNDTFTSNDTNNIIDGNSGSDTVDYAGTYSLGTGYRVLLGGTANDLTIMGLGGMDRLINIETLTLTNSFLSTTALIQSQTAVSYGFVGDFDGDGRLDDLIWRNGNSGDISAWFTQNGVVNNRTLPGGTGLQWQSVGVGDFDADGRINDLLWRNATTGDVVTWNMENGAIGSVYSLGGVNLGWQLVSVGNFDADGSNDDILWRNTATGDVATWNTTTGSVESTFSFGSAGLDWQIVGLGDFEGDGRSDDILWRNTGTGNVVTWLTTDGVVTNTSSPGGTDFIWQIFGMGDFDNDGRTDDVVWRNTASGDVVVWNMTNGLVTSTQTLGGTGQQWQISGTGDFDGDTFRDDILWRNSNDGAVVTWHTTAGSVSNSVTAGSAGLEWIVM